MEIKYLEDGLLEGAKVFDSNCHFESVLFSKENELLKIFKPIYSTPERERTIILLGEIENEECAIPKYLIHSRKKKKPFIGYGMHYYSNYKCLESKLLS